MEGVAGSAQLKQLVQTSVEVAVTEIIQAVTERSMKVACTTTDPIIKKDFALDPDEGRMRTAAHHMVRNLTAAMVMITCRDHLLQTITKNIKQRLVQLLSRASPAQVEQVEQIAANVAQMNVGIARAFVQKTAAEKAVLEMDKRLKQDYEARKMARTEGRRYCDSHVLTYQAERMPEQIRLKVGRVTPKQMAVYEEFLRNIPGFIPIPANQSTFFLQKPVAITTGIQQPQAYRDELTNFLLLTERVNGEIERTLSTFTSLAPTSPMIPMLHSLLEGLLLLRNNSDLHTLLLLCRKIVENLLESMRDVNVEIENNQLPIRFRDIHLFILKTVADQRAFGPLWASKNITKWWSEAREDVRYNLDVVDWLLRSNLINLQLFDEHMAMFVEDPRNHSYGVLFFMMSVIQMYLLDDPSGSVMTEADLSNTLDALMRFCRTRQGPEGLVKLLESLQLKNEMMVGAGDRTSVNTTGAQSNPQANTQVPILHFHSGVTQARDFQVPQ